jgi:hypothetical protein
MFGIPGGKGKYLDTLVEFLSWLQPQPMTTREDASTWFGERFNGAKSEFYLPVIRDLGLIEMEKGRKGQIRITPTGAGILKSSRGEQSRTISEQLLSRFVANREILGTYAASREPLSVQVVHERLKPRFPTWTTFYQIDYRVCWMASAGLLRPVSGRIYTITDLGTEFSRKYPFDAGPTPPDSEEVKPGSVAALIEELRGASTDSGHPDRFEAVLSRAFEMLGFSAKQLGAAGDTDVLVDALAGDQTYSVVVDAKARGSGKVDQLEVLSLKDHQALNRAEYAIVVAGSFAGGKVAGHAQEQAVTLLPLKVLESWIRLHDSWPQDVLVYRSLFTIKGLVEELPNEILRVTNDRKRWGKLLADIVDLFVDTYENGLREPLLAREIFRMLVTSKRGVHYPEKDVAGVLDLLSHPVIGALSKRETGYILAMSRETLALRLRRLAEEVESSDDEGSTQ